MRHAYLHGADQRVLNAACVRGVRCAGCRRRCHAVAAVATQLPPMCTHAQNDAAAHVAGRPRARARAGQARCSTHIARDRSSMLLNALLPRMLGLVEEVRRLRTAVVPWPSADTPPESADKEWVAFTLECELGEEQRAAIKAVLDELLAPYDEMIPSGLWKSPEIWAVVGYGAYGLAIGADPVFCPDGPTSAQALVVAKAVTTLVVAGWAGFVLHVATKTAAAPGLGGKTAGTSRWSSTAGRARADRRIGEGGRLGLDRIHSSEGKRRL